MGIEPEIFLSISSWNTKGGSTTVPFDWFGLVCFANRKKIVSCHIGDSKPVKQEVNGTVILPPLVFPDLGLNDTL